MALTDCIKSTVSLSKDDINTVLENHDAYKLAGWTETKSTQMAVNDVLIAAKAEKQITEMTTDEINSEIQAIGDKAAMPQAGFNLQTAHFIR